MEYPVLSTSIPSLIHYRSVSPPPWGRRTVLQHETSKPIEKLQDSSCFIQWSDITNRFGQWRISQYLSSGNGIFPQYMLAICLPTSHRWLAKGSRQHLSWWLHRLVSRRPIPIHSQRRLLRLAPQPAEAKPSPFCLYKRPLWWCLWELFWTQWHQLTKSCYRKEESKIGFASAWM